MLYLGGSEWNRGVLEQGDVIALYNYLGQILIELIKLANLIVTMTKAVSCQKRIGKVLDAESEQDVLDANAAEGDPQYAVLFDHVSLSYAGGGNALSDVTFAVRKGETVGILGGTGAGKSTLVNLIPRFYPATEGRVFLNGKDVNSLSAVALREKTVGIVPQKAVLFQGTIRSNLLWGNQSATDEELMTAVRIAQAEDVVAAKGGLDGEIAQEGKNLSGGQRQRLTIARALVKQPKFSFWTIRRLRSIMPRTRNSAVR